ncbi:hypothetical protein ED203_03485 [Escherichia coli]|nr:hypothetical protein [Escherichia coli]MBB8130539.1 hypothetical protein [Escherichia coli]HBB0099130.1 hypothetical protein [Escherichia coli]
MMRKGLSKDEMDNMPITLFYSLYIFDTFLEPQSPVFHDDQMAMLQYTMYMTSPNMTRDFAKKIKPSQFRTINDDKVFLTKKDIEERERKKQEENKAKLLSIFDPAMLNTLKKGN